ncbi:MAG: dihydrofolate reductase [Bacteroidales bacterium]|nr:dihydrofolate reductase [Bacteroidales bacterium]
MHTSEFNFVVEQFADLRILRYQVPGFEDLSLNQKKLIYYLSQAALCGRDILYDQNGEFNLLVRRALENIYVSYKGNRDTDEWKKFELYLKRIWFANGIYHHYSSDKILPGFSEACFRSLVAASDKSGFETIKGKSLAETIDLLIPVMFDPQILPKKVLQDPQADIVAGSAVNFYGSGVTQREAEDFYSALKDTSDATPVSHGLNSKLFKENNKLSENIWKVGGLYSPAIEKIVFWLEKALEVADTPVQQETIAKLIEYYRTGNLKTWDEYNVLWVSDLGSHIDFVNGFIEVYSDPLGIKATWESIVNFKDIEATRRARTISENAQWFEDNSPVDKRFKKKEVKGISAKVITVAMLGGDCYPATPIGINLPNADWIRKEYGSKSVTLENITYAYSQANLVSGFLEEFSLNGSDMELEKKYGPLADNLHIDLHECLGHGSGQLLPGVSSEALKNYHSPLEETRADLFALYYIMDPKMVELGLMPDLDVAKVQYLSYIRNGLMTQLRRIEPGKNIEQAHMRNRQIISRWCFEKGRNNKVIEMVKVDGKTFIKINDYKKLRELFGELLNEVQRIKSEGDYLAGRQLVEGYGVKVDTVLHQEVLARFEKLNIAPYSGFINPEYELVTESGAVVDVKIYYTNDYAAQMLKYSREYSFLPATN